LDENEVALFVDFGISKLMVLDEKKDKSKDFMANSALGNGTI
jgi:hypothetical protein